MLEYSATIGTNGGAGEIGGLDNKKLHGLRSSRAVCFVRSKEGEF